MQIELASVEASPFQVRTNEKANEEIVELAESIRQHGLLQPIKVRPSGDGYELVYGHRRVAAMRYLGWETCEAVVEGVDSDTSRVQGLIENLQRKAISSVELGEGLRKLQEATRWTQRELAEKLSISPQSVGVALRLVDRLSDRLKPLVQSAGAGGRFVENGLSSYQAYEIAITSTEPELQEALANKVMRERIPHPQIREVRKALQAIPPGDKASRQRLLNTPWIKTAEEISSEAQSRPEMETREPSSPSFTDNQWHEKCLWNAKRLSGGGIDFFTIGYAERYVEQFLEILKSARVRTLVDARADPVSQFKPGFSKKNLHEALARERITYVHMRELGVPSEKRRQLRLAQDYDSFFRWYDAQIADIAVSRLTDPALARPVAIMCVELSPTRCHRHRIAIALERQGYSTVDL
jgi:ParB/RepB/Spo0J family partition protein